MSEFLSLKNSCYISAVIFDRSTKSKFFMSRPWTRENAQCNKKDHISISERISSKFIQFRGLRITSNVEIVLKWFLFPYAIIPLIFFSIESPLHINTIKLQWTPEHWFRVIQFLSDFFRHILCLRTSHTRGLCKTRKRRANSSWDYWDKRELEQPRRRRQQKPLQICIFDNEKQYFCTLCTCIFHLLTFWGRSRSFYDVKWPVLQMCGRREHMRTKVQFCLLMSQALVPI